MMCGGFFLFSLLQFVQLLQVFVKKFHLHGGEPRKPDGAEKNFYTE